MASQYLTALKKQVRLIEQTYIDFPYDPLGDYTKKNLLNAGAYILLTHAEIESYIEELT